MKSVSSSFSLFFLILFLSISSFSYSQEVKIIGHIISSTDNLPIENVNIVVKGTNKGTSSNKEGSFTLNNIKLPCVLKLSHLIYLQKEISLSKRDISKNNTISLNIELNEKVSPLSEVFIRAKPYYSLERLVYDFEIDDNNLYLICNKKDKKQLQVYSFEDYKKRTQELPKECNEVSFDCSNRLRVMKSGREDYWRINYSDTSLKYTPYDSILNGIGYIIANPKNYVQRNIFLKEDESIPNLVNRSGVSIIRSFDKGIYVYNYNNELYKKQVYLYRLYESKGKIKYKMVYFSLMDIGEYLNFDVVQYFHTNYDNKKLNNNIAYQIKQLSILKDITQNFLYKLNIPTTLGELYYGKPLMWLDPTPNRDNILVYYRLTRGTIPINFIANKNYLYIFNYEGSIIHIISKDNILIKSIPMDNMFLNDYRFIDDILFNREGNRCFIVIKKFTSVELKELDLETGKYLNTIKLEFPNIEKIRMVKNYIYYTVPIEGDYGMERQLYKQKLD